MELGKIGTAELTVTEEVTAKAVGSGSLTVFSTPHMVALMEEAACRCIQDDLEDGQSSVGTKLDIAHVAATPIGMRVRAEAKLTAADGRRLTFAVSAFDDSGLIGEGTHERFIIFTEKFLGKTYAKLG